MEANIGWWWETAVLGKHTTYLLGEKQEQELEILSLSPVNIYI